MTCDMTCYVVLLWKNKLSLSLSLSITVSLTLGEWLTAMAATTAAVFILCLPVDDPDAFDSVSLTVSTLHFRPPNT